MRYLVVNPKEYSDLVIGILALLMTWMVLGLIITAVQVI